MERKNKKTILIQKRLPVVNLQEANPKFNI